MRDHQVSLQPGMVFAALAALGLLAGCATLPRPAGQATADGERSALRFGAAAEGGEEGFTEAAYRSLIEELGAATDRLAHESPGLDPEVRADLLLHMAVAYQGLSQYERVLDQQRYDAAMRACVEDGRGDCREIIQPDFSRSDDLEDTARTCVRMLKRIRGHERAESMRNKLRTQ